jgi:hypothetical protein
LTRLDDTFDDDMYIERCLEAGFANIGNGYQYPLTNKYRCLNINNYYVINPELKKCLGSKGSVNKDDWGWYERMPT